MRPCRGLFGALVLLTATAGVVAAGDAPVSPPAESSVTVSAAAPADDVPTVQQEMLTLPEIDAFFDKLKMGTAVRLTYINGAEYAGNFEGKVEGRSAIICRDGIFSRRTVPLATVRQAYVMLSSTDTVRIRRSDFQWSEK